MKKRKNLLIIVLAMLLGLCSCGGYEKGTDDYDKNESVADASSEQSDVDYAQKYEEKLKKVQELIEENYLDYNDNNTTIEEAYEDAIAGYVASLNDKYSAYYPPELRQKVTDSIDGSFVGIGVYATINEEEKRVQIIYTFEDGPAAQAGILSGDIIMSIDGEDVYDVPLEKVVEMMKGVEGTRVVVGIRRESGDFEYEIIRRKIETQTVYHQMLEDSIGYIMVSAFDTVTVNQFSKAVDSLLEDGAKSLIIDIRENGGGSLYSVTALCDKLLDKDKLVLYVVDKKGEREDSKTKDEEKVDLPIVVLVNERTASASEVFAGCLRIHADAKLIGTKTFGKGIMQQYYTLEDGSSLKLTIAKWYLADDTNVQDNGLDPDIVVEQGADSTEDDVLNKAVEYLKGLE